MLLDKPDMVLLDVDGTLIDTVPDLANSIDQMMHELGFSGCGETSVRAWVGDGVERLIKSALTEFLSTEPDPIVFEKACTIFNKIYADNTCVQSQLYDGVLEGLAYLEHADIKLGCVTNKKMSFTEVLLKKLGLYDKFEIIIAGDSLPKKKPDPMPLLHAAEIFSVSPERMLMIGDSKNDVDAARAAGIKCVCVSYGYNHGKDMHDLNPDCIIDTLADISKLIN